MLHHQVDSTSINRSLNPTGMERPLLLMAPPSMPHRQAKTAMALVDESGAVVGGYRDGRFIEPAAAQLLLADPRWAVVDGHCNPWSGELPELQDDEDDCDD